jgi:hypothetical protein
MKNQKQRSFFLIITSAAAIFLLFLGGQRQFRASAASVQQVDTFQATKDTYISDGSPGSNYGNSGALFLGKESMFGDRFDGLLHFDISTIPANAEIVSATLELYHPISLNAASEGALPSIAADTINEEWFETLVNWNNRPTSSNWGDPPTTLTGLPTWQPFEITQVVKRWHAIPLNNFGVLLRLTFTEYGVLPYDSSESFNVPRLHVAWIIPTATPTGTLPPSDTPTPTPSNTPTPTNTATPTPTATSIYACPGIIDLIAEKDTYAVSEAPEIIYGLDSQIKVGVDRVGADQIYWSYLRFPVEDLPSGFYIHRAELRLGVEDIAIGQQAPWRFGYYSLAQPFSETGTNWLNLPQALTYFGSELVSNTQPQTLDDYYGFLQMVRAWYDGSDPNHGMGLIGIGGDYIITYTSREGINPPILRITCDDQPPPPPPTVTPTLTPTASPTPTSSPAPASADLLAWKLEVTQGIQDRKNEVRLVAGKRTFVRLHVFVEDPGDLTTWVTTAELDLYHNGNYVGTILPIDTAGGFKNLVPQASQYATTATSFHFEIPSDYTNGSLRLVGRVNPDGNTFLETNEDNNRLEEEVSFDAVPAFRLALYPTGYRAVGGSTYFYPTANHGALLQSWLERAYPVPDVYMTTTNYQYEGPEIQIWPAITIPPQGGIPGCETMVSILNVVLYWDTLGGIPPADNWKFYSLIDDALDFVRGCSGAIPSGGAAGPAAAPGNTSFGWDTDSSMADWYGGHELSHAWGRVHTGDCGADIGAIALLQWFDDFYPYPFGSISPNVGDPIFNTSHPDETVYGFDYVPNLRVYTPAWKDFMSYCPSQWISDHNYEILLDNMQNNLLTSQLNRAMSEGTEETDRLMITGYIDPNANEMVLYPMFVLPDAPDLKPLVPGEYTIVLRNSGGQDLARYGFTPDLVETNALDAGEVGESQTFLMVTELVPFIPGTYTIEFFGPEGVLATITRGDSVPEVQIVSPNGGEVLFGENITVSWEASEGDAEAMFFNLQYSPDGGRSWKLVAQNLVGSSTVVSRSNLSGSGQGLFKIWATDGFNTESDQSDAVFSVANAAPEIVITSPEDGHRAVLGQTIGFSAAASDEDNGNLDGSNVAWFSSLDAWLGEGDQISLDAGGLSVGTHLITAFADDGLGGIWFDTIEITIYESYLDVPAQADELSVSPGEIILEPARGIRSGQIVVNNIYNGTQLTWQATVSDPWIILDDYSGRTADVIEVTVDESLLDFGEYTGTINVYDPNSLGSGRLIRVQITLSPYFAILPIILR